MRVPARLEPILRRGAGTAETICPGAATVDLFSEPNVAELVERPSVTLPLIGADLVTSY